MAVKALGRKRVPIDVVRDVPGVVLLLADILQNTTPYSRPARVGKRRVRFMASTSDLRAEQPEERGGGIAASALCTSASHVLSPTPPRLTYAVTAPHRTSAQLSPTHERQTAAVHLPTPLPLASRGRLSPTPERLAPPAPPTQTLPLPAFSPVPATGRQRAELSPIRLRGGVQQVDLTPPRQPARRSQWTQRRRELQLSLMLLTN